MKQFLFFALLACFTAHSSCSSEFRSFRILFYYYRDFNELCPNDQFDYEWQTVNSEFAVRVERQLYYAGDYALEDVNYQDLFNKTDADQLEEIRSAYHKRLMLLYGPNYLNYKSYSLKELVYNYFTTLRANLTSFKGKGKNPNMTDVILDRQISQIEKAKNISRLLNTYKIDTPVIPKSDLETIQNSLESLEKDVKNSGFSKFTAIIFSPRKIGDLFKSIYKFDGFVPERNANAFKYNWKKDTGQLRYTLHVPFHQYDSKWLNKSRPCVQAKDLPDFYQLKGKIND